MKSILITIFLFGTLFGNDPKYKYYLTACSIFKNEPYLKEWIEYNQLLGVDHFYLYNNECDNSYHELDVLAPYIAANIVTLIDWPNRIPEEKKNEFCAWFFYSHETALYDGIRRAKGVSKWLAAIDIDEFVVPVQNITIPEVLKKYENEYPGIYINWRLYGTSGYNEVPRGKLLIEVMNKKSFPHVFHNMNTKCILRPEFFEKFTWPSPHKCAFVFGMNAYPVQPDEMVINHYLNRDLNYFYKYKIQNKEKQESIKLSPADIEDWLNRGNDMDDVEKTIHRYVPELRKRMGLDS